MYWNGTSRTGAQVEEEVCNRTGSLAEQRKGIRELSFTHPGLCRYGFCVKRLGILILLCAGILQAESVFIVGHSLVGPDLPHMLKSLLEEGHVRNPIVEAQIINGAPLKWNWEHSATAEGKDGKQRLVEFPFTSLILTPASPIQQHLTWSDPETHAALFYERALQRNEACQLYLYVTWPTRDSSQWKQGIWELERIMDYKGMSELAQALTLRFPKQPAVRLIPASTAIRKLLDAIAADQVPGMADADAVFADDIHLTPAGTYFMACVFYCVLTEKPPLGLSSTMKDRWGKEMVRLSEETARALQQLAWRALHKQE